MTASVWPMSLPLPAGFASAVRDRGPALAAGLFALAIGIQLASLLANYFTTAGASPVSAAAAGYTPPSVDATRPRLDLGSLVSAHLFGQSATDPSAAANAPQTSMSLVLAGVLAADDPGAGYAIVGETAAAAKLFPVGGSLPGGAKLHAVYGDRIVIDRGGTLESLALPRQSALGLVTVPPPPAASLQPTELGDRMRQAIAQNPSVLGNVLRAQQVMAGGKQRGFRVYPGSSPAAFSRLGLRPGDLITSINGTALDDPARGDEIMRTLGAASEVRVTVMRNGRQNDLVLDMTRIAAEAEQLVGTEGMAPVDQAPPMPASPE